MISFNNEKDRLLIIPMALNFMKSQIDDNLKKLKFDYEIDKYMYLSSDFVFNILSEIVKIDYDGFVVIDMSLIDFYASRSFECFKEEMKHRNIIFINISDKEPLVTALKEDLDEEKIIYDNKMLNPKRIYSLINDKLIDAIESTFDEQINHIIESCTEEKHQFLNSSSVWCNKYIDFKNVFSDNYSTLIITYFMAKKILDNYEEFDELICTSKTGAILASILGKFLNKSVVYCISIGPIFACDTYKQFNDIKKNKKYLYICDFICLGTEIKILNAITTQNNSSLIGGVSIATYIDTKHSDLSSSILCKMSYLININNERFYYKISNSRKNLEELLYGYSI